MQRPLLLGREELAILRRLADQLTLRISPLVAIEPVPIKPWAGLSRTNPETFLIDISGIGRWFGSEQAVLREASTWLVEHELQAAMAIADTAAAAWAIVRFGRRETVLVPPGRTLPATASLPVQALRLTHEVAHQLDRLGVTTIADLLRLPRSGLASRLGADLMKRIDELTGGLDWALAMHRVQPEDIAVHELEYPSDDRAIIEHRLRGLIETLSKRLDHRRQGALRLECQFDGTSPGDDSKPQRRQTLSESPETLEATPIELGLFSPTADAEHLCRLLFATLEHHTLPEMVQRLTVAVTLTGPLESYQPTLFDTSSIGPRSIDGGRSLARLVETLSGRLGRQSVLGIQPIRNPLPEAAFLLRPLAGEPLPGGRGRQSRGRQPGHPGRSKALKASSVKSPRLSTLPPSLGPQASDPLRRPQRLLSTARPIKVVVAERGGPPLRVCLSRTWQRVIRHWGPERIETQWWNGPQIRRDYYRIETEDGGWWWVYREPAGALRACWSLHGKFG